MKTAINYVLAAFFGLFLNTADAQDSDNISADTVLCLEINGRILTNGKAADNTYTVELIENNTVIQSFTKKDKKSFSFVLKKDTYYAIRIVKEGFAPKLVSVYTQLPHEKLPDDFFEFSFKTELIGEEEFHSLDQDSQDFPIAIVSFDKRKKAFDYNEKYTENIKKNLYFTVTASR